MKRVVVKIISSLLLKIIYKFTNASTAFDQMNSTESKFWQTFPLQIMANLSFITFSSECILKANTGLKSVSPAWGISNAALVLQLLIKSQVRWDLFRRWTELAELVQVAIGV